MTLRLLFIIILLSSMHLTSSFGQTSSNEIFEQAKGSLLVPITKYKQLIDIDSRRSAYTFNRTDSSLSFVADSACQVRAAFEGTVINVFQAENNYYCLITRYGDYFIS